MDTELETILDAPILEQVEIARNIARELNPDATFIEAASPLLVDGEDEIRDKRVLVVEDDPRMREAMVRALVALAELMDLMLTDVFLAQAGEQIAERVRADRAQAAPGTGAQNDRDEPADDEDGEDGVVDARVGYGCCRLRWPGFAGM